MNPGPKPLSGNVVDITGGHSRVGANSETEPQPEGEVKAPVFVKGRAAEIWAEEAPAIIKTGVLTSWDVRSFGTWCVLMAEFEKSPKKFTTAKFTEMRRLGELFGKYGQSSRARLKSSAKSADPTAKFFAS